MAMGDALAEILGNLITSLDAAITPLTIVAWLVGFVFLGLGVIGMKRAGDHGQGCGRYLCSIVIGLFLMAITGALNALSESIFGHETQMLSSVPSASGPVGSYVAFGITLVVVVGYYCVIKGFVKLKATGDGKDDQFWSGLTHILGGLVCCNIVSFARILGASAGGVVQDVVNKLFG